MTGEDGRYLVTLATVQPSVVPLDEQVYPLFLEAQSTNAQEDVFPSQANTEATLGS